MKKILALVLALALIATLGITSAFAADDGFVDGKFTETRKITVELFKRGDNDPAATPYAEYIKNGMLEKYNVEVEFVIVGRWSEVDDLNNLLAGGSAADVSYTYSYPTILNYAEMDAVLDLAPLVEEYKDQLPNLFTLLGEDNVYWDKDPETGKLWAIETKLENNARINTFIRKDWLDKLGMALPTTKAEFEACLIAFRDNAELLLGEEADKMIAKYNSDLVKPVEEAVVEEIVAP
ncbi:MAG: extracellular solute-binding protein, partial [Clostridia bacterium]|nr:extracellular solute-binding protein [Clostridia bacterium]